MSLQDISIQDHYRSDRNNLIQDFYIPCLSETTLYSRAVGYFSSTSIVAVAQGLAALIEASGKMRLVASPCLFYKDKAIANQKLNLNLIPHHLWIAHLFCWLILEFQQLVL